MEYRSFGKTDLKVSALGMGCAPFQSRASKKDSLHALQIAFEGGICFFDTANTYGQGGSEAVLGMFFSGRRDKAILCTKAGQAVSSTVHRAMLLKQFLGPAIRPFRRLRKAAGNFISSQTSTHQYEKALVTASVEGSLRRLRTDYIDILLLHSPSKEILEQADVFETLRGLKQVGKIREFGVACNTKDEAIASLAYGGSDLSCIQISFNVLEHDGASTILALAKESQVAVVARAPFANGQLWKVPTPAALLPYIRIGMTLSQAAIKWVLDHREVSVVLPSQVGAKHLRENLGVFRGEPTLPIISDNDISEAV